MSKSPRQFLHQLFLGLLENKASSISCSVATLFHVNNSPIQQFIFKISIFIQMDNSYFRYLNSLKNEPLMFEQKVTIVKIYHIENICFFSFTPKVTYAPN